MNTSQKSSSILIYYKVVLIISFFIVSVNAQVANQILLNSDVVGKSGNIKEIQKSFNDFNNKEGVNGGLYTKDGKKQKAPNWKIFKRLEYYLEQRVNPATGEFPKTNSILEYSKSEFANSTNKMHKQSGYIEDWINLGTNYSTGGYSGLGRINCVAFHPSDNNTFWVGSPSGGIWKTTNAGSSWTILNNNELVLGVSDIIIPSDYSTSSTIYIATGDRDGGSLWTLGGDQGADNVSVGVLKSTDGGATWNSTGLTYQPSDKKIVYKLLVHPANSQILIAATSDGIYKSTDAGTTWAKKNPNKMFDLKFNSGDPSIVYASTGSFSSSYVFRSTNSGETWSITATIANGRRGELAVSPNDPAVVYLLVGNSSGGLVGVYKSTNSGAAFSQVNTNSTQSMFGYYSDGSGTNSGQSTYDICIAASPTDANTVFIGGINTWKTTDGGVTWTINNMWTSSSTYNPAHAPVVHADKHTLAFQNGSTLFEGNDGGIYKTSNGGTIWNDLSNGLVISQIYRIGLSKTDSSKALTGLQDNGSKKYNGGLNSWTDVTGGDGMECVIDYNNATSYMYTTYHSGLIYRSSNGFSTTSTKVISDNIPGNTAGTGGGAWVTPYIMNPANSANLFVGYDEVWKTMDRGDSWTSASQKLSTTTKIRSLVIAPSNTQVLYAADLTNLWKTTDGGATDWTPVSIPLTTASITCVLIKNDDPNTIWITFGGFDTGKKIFKSTDGGNNWTNISDGLPNLPVMNIVQYKKATDREVLFIGTDVGVYVKDGVNLWEAFNSGLPNVVVSELEIFYGTVKDRLRAGTFGRGLWETEISSPIGIPVLFSPLDNAINISLLPTLKWYPASGATGYNVQLSTDPDFNTLFIDANVSDTTLTLSSALANNIKYYWRVKATGGEFSEKRSFTTLPFVVGIPVLFAPSDKSVNTSIVPLLKWYSLNSISEYNVQLSSDSAFSTLVLDVTVNDTVYNVINPLTNNTKYFWRVKAKGGQYSDKWSFTTPAQIIPVLNYPVKNALVYTLTPLLSWNITQYIPGIQYDVILSTDSQFASGSTVIIPAGTSTVLTLTTLIPSTHYYWKVRSKTASGEVISYSISQDFTTFGSLVSPIPSWPIGNATVYTNSPTLFWYMNSSAYTYTFQVRYKESSSTVWSAIQSVGSNLFLQLNGLNPGTRYDWEVRSFNGSAYSDWNATQTFSTFGNANPVAPQPVVSYPTGGVTVYSLSPVIYWYVNTTTAGLEYTIEVSKNSDLSMPVLSFTGITNLYQQLSSLDPGSLYYWRVKSYNGSVYSVWSSTGSFYTHNLSGNLKPVLTYPVGGATVYSTTPMLYWYTLGGVAGVQYEIQYALGSPVFSTSITSSSTFCTLPALENGGQYFWRVRAKQGSITSDWSNIASFEVTGKAGSLTPILTWPIGGALSTISPMLSWYVNSFVSGMSFTVEYADNVGFNNSTVVTTTDYFIQLSALNAGTQYYWRVKTFNGTAFSPYSVSAIFTTSAGSSPAKPLCGSPVGGVTINTNTPVFSWFVPASMPNATYELQYSNSPDFGNPVSVNNLNSSTYIPGSLGYSLPVYWRVRSKTPEGIYSQYSEPERFVSLRQTSVELINVKPNSFALLQNYPNPFNPATSISFSLPENSYVKISVYNQLAEKIAELVNGHLEAGNHSVQWNASGFPSGIYFYQMNCEKFNSVKKLILLK